MKERIVIGVTDCSKYSIYSNWIGENTDAIEIVKLSYRDDNFDAVKRCRGVLLTGGEDVHPRFYNKPEYFDWCCKEDIDEQRDAFEWKLLEYTQQHAVPVLGICRGLQIANVYFGGTLIPDIPAWGKFNHSKMNGRDRYHPVQLDATSWLYKIIGVDNGMINSNHHQSAGKIGNGLVACALSPDGIVEAIERKETHSAPFLCLVQWHPERMEDQHSPFVKNIKQAFIEAVKKSSNERVFLKHI